MANRSCILLTGATGHIGQQILLDLLRLGKSVAVAVRPRGLQSPEVRVERWCQFWEKQHQQTLIRPRVVDWDVRKPIEHTVRLEGLAWLLENVCTVIHCAGNVQFVWDAASGEPLATNYQGTSNVLRLASRLGNIDFHHVSTAYVCGNRSGTIYEDEQEEGQGFRSVYEQSKLIAEQLVTEFSHRFRSATIYRPSIVVGHSDTGFSPSYQTLYSGLQFVSTVPMVYRESVQQITQLLGIVPSQTKNIVPLDWVSRTMMTIIEDSNLHGRTYHLTNPVPTTFFDICQSMVEAIDQEAEAWQSLLPSPRPPTTGGIQSEADPIMQSFLHSFQSYFSDDPIFDRSQLNSIPSAIACSCPTMKTEILTKLFRHAIRSRFRSLEQQLVRSRQSVDSVIDGCREEFSHG